MFSHYTNEDCIIMLPNAAGVYVVGSTPRKGAKSAHPFPASRKRGSIAVSSVGRPADPSRGWRSCCSYRGTLESPGGGRSAGCVGREAGPTPDGRVGARGMSPAE